MTFCHGAKKGWEPLKPSTTNAHTTHIVGVNGRWHRQRSGTIWNSVEWHRGERHRRNLWYFRQTSAVNGCVWFVERVESRAEINHYWSNKQYFLSKLHSGFVEGKSILHFTTSERMNCSSDLENLPWSGIPRKTVNRSGPESCSGAVFLTMPLIL